jgi:Soluble lytic murein transglycosylase and related regulatory proteins (some contain LysM/invasin domains)
MKGKLKYVLATVFTFLLVGKSQAYQQCVEEASRMYGINPLIVYAIIKTESGFNPHAVNKNRNGTYDIGLMQVNSSWLPFLSRYGYTVNHLFDPCINAKVGTWILAKCINKFGLNWKAIDCYNKGEKNATGRGAYVWKVYEHMLKLAYGNQTQPNYNYQTQPKVVKTSYKAKKKTKDLVIEEKSDGKIKHIQITYEDDE